MAPPQHALPQTLLDDSLSFQAPNGGMGFWTADDARVSPIDLSSFWLRGRMGLHLLDLQFAQGDLIDMVARRAAIAGK